MGLTDTVLSLQADLQIQASEGDRPPRVEGLIYGGGSMKVHGWGVVVIDLSRLELPQSVVLLSDHDNRLEATIGSGTPVSDGRTIRLTGTLSLANQAATRIVQLAKDRVPLGASVGVSPTSTRKLSVGESLNINGRRIEIREPTTLIAAGRLREVSITPVAADPAATLQVSAKAKGFEMSMETENTTAPDLITEQREAAALEAERLASISRICAGGHYAIQARAIREVWDPTRCELEVMRADRESETAEAAGPAVHRGIGRRPTSSNAVEACLLLRAGYRSIVEEQYAPSVVDQAERFRSMSLVDLVKASLAAGGQTIPADRDDMLRAGLSYIDMTTALSNTGGKVLEAAYAAAPASWRSFCAVKSAQTFHAHTSIRPSFVGNLQKVYPGGTIFHGTMAEDTFEWQVDTYARMLSVDRKDLVNDDLGVFSETLPAMGRAAARSVNTLCWSVIQANANSFFGGGHGNSSVVVLGTAGLSALVKAMRSQTDDAGSYLDIVPQTLVTGPTLEPTARALLSSMELARYVASGTDAVPVGNPWEQIAALVIEPRITSLTSYYLFSSPSDAGVIAAFLQGKEVPTLETFPLNHQPEKLCVSWRCYLDYGFALGDYRAAAMSAGTG